MLRVAPLPVTLGKSTVSGPTRLTVAEIVAKVSADTVAITFLS